MRQITFYRTQSGTSPVEKFLDSLEPKLAKKVTWTLRLIEDMDQVPVQYFKKLKNTNDIWEIRTRIGSNSIRILGFLEDDKLVVLTNGFYKKSQKTPKHEIELAQQRKTDYLTRNGGSK